MEMIGGYRVHQAANLLPEPSPDDRARLKADIEEHGLLVPIVITKDNQILDGRTRAKILNELGINFMFDELGIDFICDRYKRHATFVEEANPVATVLSLNAARRHLTGDQIIAIYLKANAGKLEADKQAAKAIQQANLKKGSAQPEKLAVILSGETAASKIAKAVGKSPAAVKRVQRVQKVVPEKLADVATGKVSAGEVLKGITGKRKPEAEPPATDFKPVWMPGVTKARLADLERATERIIEVSEELTPAQYKRLGACRSTLQWLERRHYQKGVPNKPAAEGQLGSHSEAVPEILPAPGGRRHGSR